MLNAKNKIAFIIGTTHRPTKIDHTFSAWNRCNNMVVSCLVHSISVPIRQGIIWMDMAIYIWNDLKTRYSQWELSHIFYLQMKNTYLNQGDLSVTEYLQN